MTSKHAASSRQDQHGVAGQTEPAEDPLAAALRAQLSRIEQEETPERLLELARELQRLLRKDEGDAGDA
jgi:hypothetical protein